MDPQKISTIITIRYYRDFLPCPARAALLEVRKATHIRWEYSALNLDGVKHSTYNANSGVYRIHSSVIIERLPDRMCESATLSATQHINFSVRPRQLRHVVITSAFYTTIYRNPRHGPINLWDPRPFNKGRIGNILLHKVVG